MRVALVTGSSRGIGRATALRLARDHEALVIHYRRDVGAANEVVRELESLGRKTLLVQAELEDEEQVRYIATAIRETFGQLDSLVANAAAGKFSPMAEQSCRNIQRTMNTSVTSFVQLVQDTTPMMPNGGSIVAVSGLDANVAVPLHGVIGAAKAALEVLVRQFAFELGDRGIRVNAVVPGAIASDSSQMQLDRSAGMKEALERGTPGRPVGDPSQVASVIAFLCSEDASFVSGESVRVDGGLSAGGGPWGALLLDVARGAAQMGEEE